MRNAFFLTAIILALSCAGVGQKAASALVTVTVVDEVGAIVPAALVEVHHWKYDKATRKFEVVQDATLKTDSHGKVSLQLLPATYDLSASWVGLLPESKRVAVPNQGTKIDVTIGLKYDRTLKPAGQ